MITDADLLPPDLLPSSEDSSLEDSNPLLSNTLLPQLEDLLPRERPSTPIMPIIASLPVSPTSPSTAISSRLLSRDKSIMIKYELDENGQPVFFITSDYRPVTIYGTTQGHHVTPYTCFIQLVLNLLENEDINDAILKISEVTNILLPDAANKTAGIFKTLEKKLEKLKQVRLRRKAATWFTRVASRAMKAFYDRGLGDSSVPEDLKSDIGAALLMGPDLEGSIRDGLKLSEITMLCDIVEEMANSVLKGLNSDEYISFLAMDGATDYNEGNRVKNARCGLFALNAIKDFLSTEGLNAIQSSYLDRIYDLTYAERSPFKRGLKKLLGLLPVTDYNESRGEEFDRQIKALENRDKKELLKFITDRLKTINIKELATRLIIDLFDFKYSENVNRPDIENILAIVCARHLVIANMCFPKIFSDDKLKAKLEENFLRLGVLKEGEWENLAIATYRSGKKRKSFGADSLNYNLLIDKISELSKCERYGAMTGSLSLPELVSAKTVREEKSSKVRMDLDLTGKGDNNPSPGVSPRAAKIGSSARVRAKVS